MCMCRKTRQLPRPARLQSLTTAVARGLSIEAVDVGRGRLARRVIYDKSLKFAAGD